MRMDELMDDLSKQSSFLLAIDEIGRAHVGTPVT